MLFIIRKTATHELVHTQAFPKQEADLDPASLHADFSPQEMEVAWCKDEFPPPYFEIDEAGIAQPLPTPPTLEVNGMFHTLGYKTHEGKTVQRTLEEMVQSGEIRLNAPFEQVNGNDISVLSAAEIMEKGAIRSLEEAQTYLTYIRRQSLEAISIAFSPSDEIKRTKAYLDWLNDDKPKNDPRKAAYDAMQAEITAIKSRYADMKAFGKKKLTEFKTGSLPTTQDTKAEIMAWLEGQGIEYNKSDTKKELLNRVNKG